jgi:uncharacterized damage-inducible protein DinB
MVRAMAWANRETLATLETLPEPPAEALRILGHALAAERLWLSRLRQEESAPSVWPQVDLKGCQSLAEQNAAGFSAFVGGLDDAALSATSRYQNLKGEPCESSVIDILTHVVIHGAYHRGQIAKTLGAIGKQAPGTDFIAFARFVEPAGLPPEPA